MDLSFTEDQLGLRDLARSILTGPVTTHRLKGIEAGPDRIDRALWAQLSRAGFLEIGGFLETCILLEEQGRAVAPVALWSTLIARQAISTFAPDRQPPEDAILAVALPGDGENRTADV